MAKLDQPVIALAIDTDPSQLLVEHTKPLRRLEESCRAMFGTVAPTEPQPWSPEGMAKHAAAQASIEDRAAQVVAEVRVAPTTTATNLVPLALPPGNAGRIARWLLDVAMLPVPEVATVTTLGILAGLTGRAWTTPAPCTGLNIYLILVARSATGKEALHEGAGRLLVALRRKIPSVVHLINFDDYASGPALAKQCAAESRSFVNFSSEFGRRLKRMANPKDAPMAELRTTFTKLYSKSGPASFVGDLVYSNARHAIPGAVAFSIVGETTPGTLRSAMTQDMMEDGFLSRFGWVEYTGERPAENTEAAKHAEPPDWLISGLAEIARQAMTMLANNASQEVQCTAEAAGKLQTFNVRCNAGIARAGDNEAHRQVWSRANLKARKYAALLAVADDHMRPTITPTHVDWCVALVERDAAIFERSLTSGDVGSDTVAQERKLLHVLREYLIQPLPPSYGVPAQMQKDGVAPRRFLQMRTSDTAAFKGHPLGATAALDHALRSLVDSGYLTEMDKVKAAEQYTFQGRCFRVVQLPPT
jgi:Protein of unknown function (DUF3987)